MSRKIIRTVGKIAAVVGAVAMIGTGIGAALGGTMMLSVLGTTVAASAIAGAASIVSVGASLLGKPKSTSIGAANSDRLNVSINVLAPRVMAFGRTALATDLRDQEYTGTNDEYLHRFIVCAAHKISAFREIWIDDKIAWTASDGVRGEFIGYLQVTPRTEGTAANAINISARMGSTRRYTGCAYLHLRFKLTGNGKKVESPFAQSVPTRLTVVGDAIPCYDPRQDSTQPGGSGSHRAGDQSTWTYGEHARNPACALGTWLLGWKIQNPQSGAWRLSVGAGLPADRIDWPSFIEAANLCDEPVAKAAGGTEPRYRCDGLTNEGETPIDGFTAAMNADLDDQDGLLRLTVFHNDLSTPDAYFTEADLLDDYTWLQTPPLNDGFNVVRGSYVDPASLYQPTPATEIRVAARDGIDRVHTADFGFVQSRSQDTRLRKQRLQRQLYGGEFRGTWLASGWKVHKNSVVYLSFAPEGWTNKKFRVAEYDGARSDGLVPMLLREEHEDIYAWDAEEGPAVQIAEPTNYSPGNAPIPQFLGTIEEGSTRNVPAQMLQDGVFLDSWWTHDGLARAFDYPPAPSGWALEIPFLGNVDSFSGYGGQIGAFIEIQPGRRLWYRFICDPAGHALIDLFDGDEPLVDGDDELSAEEYSNANWKLEAAMDWFAADGTPISRAELVSVSPAGGRSTIVGWTVPPAGAWKARVLFGHSAQLNRSGSWAVWSPWIAEHQPSADITSENAPSMDVPPDQVIELDADLAPKPGQLPRTLLFVRKLGDRDVTSVANWSVSSNGLTASIDNDPESATRGAVTVVAMDNPAEATLTVTSDYDLVPLSHTVKWRKNWPETATTPAGGGSGGSGARNTVLDISIGTSSTSYSQAALVTVSVGTGEMLKASTWLQYGSLPAGGALAVKFQYSPSGANTWTDIAAEVIGAPGNDPTYSYGVMTGAVGATKTASGLTAGDYDVRLMARAFSGGSGIAGFGEFRVSVEA